MQHFFWDTFYHWTTIFWFVCRSSLQYSYNISIVKVNHLSKGKLVSSYAHVNLNDNDFVSNTFFFEQIRYKIDEILITKCKQLLLIDKWVCSKRFYFISLWSTTSHLCYSILLGTFISLEQKLVNNYYLNCFVRQMIEQEVCVYWLYWCQGLHKSLANMFKEMVKRWLQSKDEDWFVDILTSLVP